MPPKTKVTGQEILDAAMELVRREGAGALNARALAQSLHCSTQPIFSNYASMEALKADVIRAADDCYQQYLRESMTSGRYPPYKASGMGYIRFAREDKELFKLLFMRDRTGERIPEMGEELRPILELIRGNLGITREQAEQFHLEMWVFVHGMATMIATGYLDWDMELVSRTLSDAYLGLRHRFMEGENECN